MPFQPGISGNPKGRPRGYQSYGDRAWYFLLSHTVGMIEDLYNDKKAMHRLPVTDALIVTRIHEAIQPGGGKSMNSLLDRIIGKPVQPVAKKVEHNIAPEITGAIREIKQLPLETLQAIRSILDDASTNLVE